jgi:hypothetical protein
MARKKGTFAKHTSRVGSRFGDRAKKFVVEARTGIYDQTRLAQDIGASVMDVAEFWGGLFGMRGSPAAALVELGPQPSATWKGAAGVTAVVVVEDPVPDDARFPIGGAGNPPLLKLAGLGGAAVNLDCIVVTIEDEENLQLRVNFRDTTPGPGSVAPGEYYGIMYYTSASVAGGPFFAALVRATVTP